jgi:putative OPT family oligopeptide transporter
MASPSKKSRGLSPAAYGGVDGDKYEPYISPGRLVPEFTIRAIILGNILGIVFAAANAYLGLRVGMTITASIPAAVISMGILRGVLKKGTILENNLVQTAASTGESLAAGIIFTVPALILMNMIPSMTTIFLIALLGGLLGVLMMIPLRYVLMVKGHGSLPFPEGTGCAEVLVAGEEGGAGIRKVFAGLGIGALYKLLMDSSACGLWSDSPEGRLPYYKSAEVGMDTYPALLGVGFIIGPRISALMLAGGALGWLVLIPLISALGSTSDSPIYPAVTLIRDMDPYDIWDRYIRYIGAGAVAVGGIISLIGSFPMMIRSFGKGFGTIERTTLRTRKDLPRWLVLGGCVVLAVAIWAVPDLKINLIGAILMVVFTFFFVTVSARVVGLVGGSSLPISGMTIAALLATSLVFSYAGYTGPMGKFAALAIGAVVCVAISCAADISQDLKTGFLVGATPSTQQIVELISVITSAAILGWVVMLLHHSFVLGSEQLPAPQATLMKLVVEGVMDKNLPWTFVLCGGFIAIVVELLGIQSLPFSVGLYLPMSLSTPIMVGGLVRWWVERKGSKSDIKEKRENGVLWSSGLIAGEATLGILIALFVYLRDKWSVLQSVRIPLFGKLAEGTVDGLISLGAFAVLTVLLIRTCRKEPLRT